MTTPRGEWEDRIASALAAEGALAEREARGRLPDPAAIAVLAGPAAFRRRGRADASLRAALRPIVWMERIGAAVLIAAVLGGAVWAMIRVPAPTLSVASGDPALATYAAAAVLVLVVMGRALLGLALDGGARG